MKKTAWNAKTYKALLLLLCAALCLPLCLTGCNGKDEQPVRPETGYEVSGTKHIFEVTDSAEKFVENGVCGYTIVYPAGTTDAKIITAANELQNFIELATGARLPVRTDAEKTDKARLLSLGGTAQAKSETALMRSVEAEELGGDGYIIETIDTAVYMLGNRGIAVLYAAYEFLHWQFSYEAYSSEVQYIDRNVTDRALKNMRVVDVPDFASRTSLHADHHDRMRTVSYVNDFNNADGNSFVHNYFNLVPTLYAKDYPEWFTGTAANSQLCLEAGGDKQSRIELKNVVVESMKARLLAQPDVDWIAFSHNDGGLWCTCAACRADYGLYDHTSNTAAFASVIRFVNLVAADIEEWNRRVCPDRDIVIFIYNYGAVSWAPVKLDENKIPVLDENGKYQPYSDELILADNVAVYNCGYDNCMTDIKTGQNAVSAEITARLAAVMSNPTQYIWSYSACFFDYMLPIDPLPVLQEKYKYFHSVGAVGLFDMGQYNQPKCTDFGALESYVSAKLMWNVQADVGKLTDDFFTGYYGPAAAAMRQAYDESAAHLKYLSAEARMTGNSSSVQTAMLDVGNVPYGLARRFIGLFESAFAAIEPLKTADPTQYDELYVRILRDTLSWRYIELVLYPDSFSPESLVEAQREFIEDANVSGLTNCAELNAIADMFG